MTKNEKKKCEWNTINSPKIRENWTMLVVVFSHSSRFPNFPSYLAQLNGDKIAWNIGHRDTWLIATQPQIIFFDADLWLKMWTNLIYSTINGCVHASSLTAQMKMIYFGFFKLISKFYNAWQLRVGSHSRIQFVCAKADCHAMVYTQRLTIEMC